MEIIVDEQQISIDDSHVHSLEEILLTVAAEHIKPTHEITTIRLNGEHYSEEHAYDAAKVMLSDVHRLEISTEAKEEIAKQCFEQSKMQVEVMVQAARKISELFRFGNEGEANQHYAEFLESLQLFMTILAESREILNLDLSAIPFQDDTAEGGLQRLSEMMGRMIQVQEGEDWIALADVLEYEVVPLLEGWQKTLLMLGATQGGGTASQ